MLPTHDKTYNWEEISRFLREGLLELLKADANVESIALTTPVTHDWWLQCSSAGRLTCDLTSEIVDIASPRLPPYSSPDDPTIQKNAFCPTVPDAPDIPLLTQASSLLSVTAKAFLLARE